MGSGGHGPRGLDFFTLSDIGAGRHLGHDGPMVLERRDGGAWIEVSRFGTAIQAGQGLDELIAEGAEADHLRLRPVRRRRRFLRRH
jgi:hypothetical protein